MNEMQNCPICRNEIEKNERYPNQICEDCAERIADKDGREIVLEFNWSGGFSVRYKDRGERYFDQFIYINGIKCKAEEDRFGRGIIIQTVEK